MRRLALLLLVLFGAAACGGEAPSGPAAGSRPGKGAAAPVFAAPEAGIELARGKEPRELVRIGFHGVAIGPTEGPLVWKLFAEPRRSDEAWYLLRTYAPFQMKTPAGELVFRGRGRAKPSLAERRMILEWSRRVAAEAAGGRAGAAYGLLLAWHQAGPAGGCEDLALYLTGEVVASACGWDRDVRGRLEPGQLGRIFGWFDRLEPFQTGGEPGEAGTQQTRLIFAGQGAQPATAREQAEIRSFAAALFAELAARRGGPVPAPAPADAEPATTTAPPAQRYLLPPGALRPRPEEIVLQLPEKPPPPPKPRTPMQKPAKPEQPTSPPRRGTPAR